MKKKRNSEKFKKAMPISFVILIVVLVIILGAASFNQPTNYCSQGYRMELYIKSTQSIEKVRECTSSSPDFECTQTYHDCTESGNHYGKAITYYESNLLSESDWQLIYKC